MLQASKRETSIWGKVSFVIPHSCRALIGSACPHLIPLHQGFILPAESLNLLVQLCVPFVVPLGRHASRGLQRDTSMWLLRFNLNKETTCC